MTDNELIQKVIEVAKDSDNLTRRGSIIDIPNRELRNALLNIFDGAWNAGLAQGKQDAQKAQTKFNQDLAQASNDLDEELDRIKAEFRKMRAEVQNILDDTTHVIISKLDATKLSRKDSFAD